MDYLKCDFLLIFYLLIVIVHSVLKWFVDTKYFNNSFTSPYAYAFEMLL